jgi:hypothetical protein
MKMAWIGFDSPNLFSSRQFRLRSVAWVAQPDPPQYLAVSTLLKEHQGRRYLLAANSSRTAVRARVNAGVEAGQVQVLCEDRRLAAQANVWDDDFAPYAVHVHAW